MEIHVTRGKDEGNEMLTTLGIENIKVLKS